MSINSEILLSDLHTRKEKIQVHKMFMDQTKELLIAKGFTKEIELELWLSIERWESRVDTADLVEISHNFGEIQRWLTSRNLDIAE